jgi:serine/threonine-protein kinase
VSKPTEVFVGRLVGGDFDLVRLLATGGMGAVYEATQRSTGKARALKMMHTWLLRDERMRERFIDEARIAGSIDS